MKRLQVWAFLLLIVVLALGAATPGVAIRGGNATAKSVKCVVEWEQVPAAEAQLPSLPTAQLRTEFGKAAASTGVRSWEARCRVTTRVPDRTAETYSTLLVVSGNQWLYERRSGDWKDEKVEYRNLCDGEHVQHVSPRQKVVSIQTRGEYVLEQAAPASSPGRPVGFPPFLEESRERHYPIPQSLPDIRKLLADPGAKVLPWRTRADGHACYVVEQTTVTESPIFRTFQDFKAWQMRNPGRRVAITLNANTKPGDKRIDKETARVALDPESGFMPVRWATGRAFSFPGVGYIQFPLEEISCTHFRKFGGQGYVAGRLEYSRYSTDKQGKQKTVACEEVVLEDFNVGRQYSPSFFHFDPPMGYQVCDSTRGIQYFVGDSMETIAASLAAAKAKKAFLEELKKKPAPPLDGALWLNTEPIRLEDARGKQIQLHFWSVGCGPCVYELPRLQKAWECSKRTRGDSSLFVSIHPYVDGDGLRQLKEILRDQRITFPVMVDSRVAKAWGRTSAHYGVYSEPTNVWIDEKGYVVRHDSERQFVGEHDRWMTDRNEKKPERDNRGQPRPRVGEGTK